ncbi:DUF6287 domain-containing protein [Streptococcus suis]|nr:DUF6287 domain-containing protein [Streptococcus suis]
MKKWIIGLVAVLAVAAAGLVWYFSQPKEMVRLSGYAMTAEDGEYLKEESFSLLAQSGKKVGTIKTDDEGYFYVRLRANETYQIQRDGFSVQVTAKGVNEYRIDQDKGYLLLGKRLEDEVSKVIYKPSVFYLKEQTDYTYARNQGTVRLEGRQDLQEGDIISLPPTKEYITGYILRVSSVAYEEDATLVTVTDDVSAKEVLQDATLDGEFDLSDGYILTNDNSSISEETVEEVAFLPGSQTSSSLTYSGSSPTPTLLAKDKIEDGVEAKWKKIKNGRAVELSYEVTDEETDGSLAVDIGLEGTIEADFDYLGGKASVKSALTFSHEASSNVKDLWDKEAEIWLATIYIPTSTGLSLPIDIYFIFETNGNVSISAKESEQLTLAMTYDKGEVEFEHDYSGKRNLNLKLEGELATGLKESSDISVAQIEILEVYAKAPLLELEGEFGFELTQENFEPVVMSDISGEFSARIGLDVGIETDLWEIEAEVAERELLSYEWEYPEEDTTSSTKKKSSSKKQSSAIKPASLSSAKQLYKAVLDDYVAFLAKIRPNSDFTSAEVMGAIEEMKFPVHSWVGESVWRSKDSLRYAFYDIDGNGTMELLTATQNNDGSMFLYGVYYINGSTPTLLTEGFVGSTAARSAITIYTDGTVLGYGWSSGTGDGGGILYELQKNNTEAKEVQTISDLNVGNDDVDARFGKTKSEVLDLKELDWQRFEEKETTASQPQSFSSRMDISAIKAGDLSSIEGTWKSATGKTFTIQGSTIKTEYGDYTIGAFRENDGRVSWSLMEILASPPQYVMVPAGTKLSTGARDYTSDESRDRIYISPQYDAPQDALEDYIFYRVN